MGKKHTNNKYKSYNLPMIEAEKLKLKREILYWAITKEDLLAKEYELTKDKLNDETFWNLRAGGDKQGFSKETRKKMSLKRKGKSPWCKGLTKETDERLRIKAEKQTGKPLSEKHRQNLHKPKNVCSSKKDKTYEELYGEEKAKLLKEKFSQQRKNKKQTKDFVKRRTASLIGRHYYNNGIIQIKAFECPEGFKLGGLKRTSPKQKKGRYYKYKNIKCLETNKIFNNLREIMNEYPQLKRSPLVRAIKAQKSYKNFTFCLIIE